MHKPTLQDLVRRELEYHNNLAKISPEIVFIVTEPAIKDIRYEFDNSYYARDILQLFPYIEPKQNKDQNDPSLAATHPVVNALYNTDLQLPQPVVLYFINRLTIRTERREYDNIHTIFDILGAIETYYLDLVNGDMNKLYQLFDNDDLLEKLIPYQDGYLVLLY